MHGFNLPCLTRNLSSAAKILCSVFNGIRVKMNYRVSMNFEEGKTFNSCLAFGLVMAKATKSHKFGFIDDVEKKISPIITRSFSDPH